jgi:hypothetical protein
VSLVYIAIEDVIITNICNPDMGGGPTCHRYINGEYMITKYLKSKYKNAPTKIDRCEKASSETRPHEGWRRADHASPSSHLAL